MLNLIILLAVNCAAGQLPTPTSTYTNNVTLVSPDIYMLYWNYTANDIVFETHVKNGGNGWSGFGLSPNGGMAKSDLIITWKYANGSTHFSDRHATGPVTPEIDQLQNWFLLMSKTQNGYLITKFTRKIKLCDNSGDDMDIVPGIQTVIFGWNNEQPKNDLPAYHGNTNRGQNKMPLISSLNQFVSLSANQKTETVDFRVDGKMADRKDTEYFCQLFEYPSDWISNKRHLIRFETILAPGNEKLVHHLVMFECEKATEDYIKKNGKPSAGSCFEEWKLNELCMKISLVWAVGGPLIQDFPSNLAYPMGGPDLESKYFVLQMHYDNPDKRTNVTDNSGFKLYVTQNYRPTEFGILTVGATAGLNSLILPPMANNFNADYFCRKDCLNNLFDQNVKQVSVFATLPHTHLKGKQLYTTLIRNGSEIAYLDSNKYYDFNYQYYNFLNNPVVIQPGDEIRTKCVYSTPNEKDFIFGGESTREEMCMDFIWYYPKSNGLSICWEEFDYESVLVPFLNELNNTGDIIFNKSASIIKVNKPSQNLTDKFQSIFKQNRSGRCVAKSGSLTSNPMTPLRQLQETCTLDTSPNIYHISSDTPNSLSLKRNNSLIIISFGYCVIIFKSIFSH